jgi:hypothetical protein
MPDDGAQIAPVDSAAKTARAEAETAVAAARIDTARARAVDDWQDKILPFVKWGTVALAVLVFASVLFGAWRILGGVQDGSKETGQYSSAVETALTSESFDANTATLGIIAYQAARQHDRAGAALLTRELLRFCGFLIGAALSFVGAIFIMGKFSDVQPTTATAENGTLKGSLVTSSPGIFALTTGAVLVGISIFAHYEIAVADPELHLLVPTGPAAASVPTVAPPPPPETAAGKNNLVALCKEFPEDSGCK